MQFSTTLQIMGCDVIIYKNYNTPEQTETIIKGLYNNKSKFEFPEKIEITNGDAIQQKAGGPIYRVISTRDDIQGDEYVSFQVFV
jgi:hypothetical protein